MSNEFIDYLNSMNNATSGNENALAEAQILNDYYEKIRVDREIGEKIYKRLFDNKARGVILTGHAGDGKTSILVQILNKIGFFNNGKKPLKEIELVTGEKKLFYVKDMSELNSNDQERYLMEFLNYPKENIPAILITNTGPLINTFKRVIEKEQNEELKIEEFENYFLDYIDTAYSCDSKVDINGEIFILDIVNIAQIDNSYFAEEIINKVCNFELWDKCETCSCDVKNKCPIYCNYKCILSQKDRVSDIIKRIYFWMNESETRLTIRQILSHLSFSITANLTCEEINERIINESTPLFKYNFANLFFGYLGTDIIIESLNIKSIRELQKLKLDKTSFLEQDNIMFVKEEFSDFTADIRRILEEELELNISNLDLDNIKSQELRRAFRRYYILFSNNENRYDEMLKELFNNVYPLYYKIISGDKLKRSDNELVKEIVFDGLYKLFTGVNSRNKDNSINLTLKKSLDEMQNVQLVLGHFNKDDIEIGIENIENIEKNIRKNRLMIKIKGIDYELTHEALNYLFNLKEGEIFTSYNPNFTFGITMLKSDLIKKCRYRDEETIRVMMTKKSGIEKLELYFDDNNVLHVRRGRW